VGTSGVDGDARSLPSFFNAPLPGDWIAVHDYDALSVEIVADAVGSCIILVRARHSTRRKARLDVGCL